MTQEEKNQQVVQPAAEQKQPTYPQFNSAADIDARFMQMMERDAERDRAEQQRRLQRQQFAQSMGDLGNVLIDTIKMSGGALVTPRDVSARYQQMDAQSQKIYDTYRARMDLLRKYQLEREKEKRAAELEREKQQATLQQNKELKQMELESKEKIAGLNNETKITVAGIRSDGSVKSAYARAFASAQRKEDTNNIYEPCGSEEIAIPKNRYDGRMAAVYAYIDRNGLFPPTSDVNADTKKWAIDLGAGNISNMPEGSRIKILGAVRNALYYIALDHPEHMGAIRNILMIGSAAGTTTGGGGTKKSSNTAPWLQ